MLTFVSSCLNSAWLTFTLGEKARRKPKYKARYGRFSRTEWRWGSLFTMVFQSYKRNVVRYKKWFSVLGIIFAWIQKIMINITDFACRILLRSLNTTNVFYILARYISLRYYWLIIINCSFISCVINAKQGSTPGIFILEGLHWIEGDIYICHYFFPLAVSADLSAFPDLTVSEVEAYAQKESGCRHTTKGYKFFAEPRYLQNVKGEFSYSKKISCEYTYTFLFESCSCF